MLPTDSPYDSARLLEHVHGHVGWLSAVALAHPAILLRDRRRRADLAVALATGLVTLTGAMGALLYGPYSDRVRQGLFIAAPKIGYLFERKEHLAFGAIVLAWGGAIAYFAATRADESLRTPLRSFAFRAFAFACVLALTSAVLGVAVAVVRTF